MAPTACHGPELSNGVGTVSSDIHAPNRNAETSIGNTAEEKEHQAICHISGMMFTDAIETTDHGKGTEEHNTAPDQ
jgi:hypothetical protein